MNSDKIDYEDLTSMRLDDDSLRSLVESGGECIFNWTTTDGYPVGVVVAYVYRHGKFWTTCAVRRKRVPALRNRPQSAIVINRNGKTASYKGDSIVHASGDEGFEQLKTWFYAARSPLRQSPKDAGPEALRSVWASQLLRTRAPTETRWRRSAVCEHSGEPASPCCTARSSSVATVA